MENLKTIELVYEWKNQSYNTIYRWYLVTEKGLFKAMETWSNDFVSIRNFTTKKEAKKYLAKTISNHKKFVNLK